MVHHDDALHDPGMWAKRQVLQIENMSKQQVLLELQSIMEGYNYSWHCINELLQARFDEGSLELSLVDGDILFEWNNLCDEKRLWEKRGRLSVNHSGFNMDCLINLKILPIQAGLGIEALGLINSNMDQANLSTADLWAGPKDPESVRRRAALRLMTDDDTSSLESDDSDYVGEEEETDDEGRDVKVVLFDDGDVDGHESDGDIVGLSAGVENESSSEDVFTGEESDDSSASSVESEVEPEDEDSESLGVRIVENDDEISDFEL